MTELPRGGFETGQARREEIRAEGQLLPLAASDAAPQSLEGARRTRAAAAGTIWHSVQATGAGRK